MQELKNMMRLPGTNIPDKLNQVQMNRIEETGEYKPRTGEREQNGCKKN